MKRSLLAIVAIFIAAAVIAKYALSVKDVRINDSDFCLNSDSVKKQYTGQNLITISPRGEETTQKERNSCAEEIKITRQFPSTLQISVKSKIPVAKIDGTDLLAAADGFVIKKRVTTSTPTIYLANAKDLKENTTISDKNAVFALQLASGLLKSDFTPSSIRIVGDDIAVYSTTGIIALFTNKASAAEQIDSLQSIVTKAKIDASKIEKIDLRFDKPTVVFK